MRRSIYAGDRLGLDRIAALLDRLGRPQDQLPPLFHVAGTNGKGSTCAFLRAALESAGHKVHVFTSPHLVRFNERIRISGKLIEDSELAALLAETLDASEGIDPSFFEATTAAAFLAFARNPADACILEVGLGGRLDATNVIEAPLVCAIAGLGFDHQSWLGNRLADIAEEKAGIAKRGAPLVTQLYPPSAAGRIGQIADLAGAPWVPRGGRWDAIVSRGRLRYRDEKGALVLPVPRLPGRHQAMNAALAVAVLRHQQVLDVSPSALGAAMSWTDWPARLQKLEAGPLLEPLPADSEFWVDGGHNPSAARQVATYVRKAFAGPAPLHILFACLTSKDAARILAPFAGSGAIIHTLPIADHDSRDPGDLAEMARARGFAADAHDTLAQALAHVAATAKEPVRILSFGSLYLAGQVLAANNQAPD
jgi:dihydrofolate synthase/folylpolyglutamate synthase